MGSYNRMYSWNWRRNRIPAGSTGLQFSSNRKKYGKTQICAGLNPQSQSKHHDKTYLGWFIEIRSWLKSIREDQERMWWYWCHSTCQQCWGGKCWIFLRLLSWISKRISFGEHISIRFANQSSSWSSHENLKQSMHY